MLKTLWISLCQGLLLFLNHAICLTTGEDFISQNCIQFAWIPPELFVSGSENGHSCKDPHRHIIKQRRESMRSEPYKSPWRTILTTDWYRDKTSSLKLLLSLESQSLDESLSQKRASLPFSKSKVV